MMQTGTKRDRMPSLATESLQSALLQAPEQEGLAPWLEGVSSDSIPCTPPPQLLSPQPLTPKPTRFVSPPRTPLPKLFTNLTPRAIRQWEATAVTGDAAAAISRPESACSNYSSSSDSSLDSLTTFATAGGSCTSPETEASFFADEPEKETTHLKPSDALRPSSKVQDGNEKKDGTNQIRVRKTKWTEEMDNHLWRTYIIYQQDPKITPFYVLPGQVPPLGVCCKVAREAKRSWKEAKMGDGWKGVPSTPRPKRKSRGSGYKAESNDTAGTGNRGDILRKTSPYSWPASEASTRRRLRELCRGSYGPSVNPHREYRQQRRTATTPRLLPPRSSTVSPSPLNSATSDRMGSRDSFLFSTRSIALSLTTSTASTMNPNGLLAAIASGYDVEPGMAAGFGSGNFNFGGIPESISGVNRCNNSVSRGGERSQLQQTGDEMEQGSPIRQETGNGSSSSSSSGPSRLGGLLPPLELKSSSSSYGTWPRRLKRQEILPDFNEDAVVFPPSRRARRGTIGDLFGNSIPSSSTTTPTTTNTTATPAASNTTRSTRSRGFTIGASFGSSLTSRRRCRPSAPLLTVTGPVSYDSPNDSEMLSPLAARHSSLDTFKNDDPFELPKRLGSPFLERKDWKGKEAEDSEEKSGLDSPLGGEFGDFLESQSDVGIITGRSTPIRPIKRVRE
ncbi:hypothetical protein L873DRAFT_1804698 [Choiromyces venosus 120613-1]|uniref:Uncharacterized protein n=1 Tax=Choiromyces venosus 120613-1 TaxID=1336337 RepID=A0A3N4JQM7_9PEZI|nr:hypothetical protein L873DRAFT_1804698 [Choiromyces venosus 120613-1]